MEYTHFTYNLNKCHFGNAGFLMESFSMPWGEDDQVVEVMAASPNALPSEHSSLCCWHYILRQVPSNSVVLDIGAYSGVYSLLATTARPDIRAICFEPSCVTYSRLVNNIKLNKLYERIIPFHGAAGSTHTSVILKHKYGPLSITSGDSVCDSSPHDHEERVQSIALDSLFVEGSALPGALGSRCGQPFTNARISAIKIDVEGLELDVLRGSQEILMKHKPFLIVEALTPAAAKNIDTALVPIGYTTEYLPQDRNVLAFAEPTSRLSVMEITESTTFSFHRLLRLAL
jgi:FkbM family methyltransferase